MTVRTVRAVAALTTCVLAAVGLLAAPSGILLAWAFTIPLLAPGAAMYLHIRHPDERLAVRRGTVLTLCGMAVVAVIAGLVVVLGPSAGLVVALAVLAVGLWEWRDSPIRRGRLVAWLTEVPVRPEVGVDGARGADLPGPDTAGTGSGSARRLGTGEVSAGAETPGTAQAPPPIRLTAMSTAELCVAWQRSYWLLGELPPGARRSAVVRMRGELLDEFERRDPHGFVRWLQTEPRPVSNPGRYLAAGS